MRTRVAKFVFWLSGQLGKIKYQQPVYKWERGSPSEPAGTQLLSHPWTYKLLFLSERIDPEHWEHWAFEHDPIPGTRCIHCKGWIPAEPGW